MDAVREGLVRGLARFLAPARLPDGFAPAFATMPRGSVFDLAANAAAANTGFIAMAFIVVSFGNNARTRYNDDILSTRVLSSARACAARVGGNGVRPRSAPGRTRRV